MKTLYLHIGFRKTGSSAIQSFITDNLEQDVFAGIMFVPVGASRQRLVSGDAPLAHHGLGRLVDRQAWESKWSEVEQFVKNSDAAKFLITSEALGKTLGKNRKFGKLLSARLESIFDRVVVIFFARRQDEYFASMLVQNAKHGSLGKRSITQYKIADAHYDQTLNRISISDDRIEFRPFVYSRKMNSIKQFLSSIDVDPSMADDYKRKAVNQSVSAEMFLLQISLNKAAAAMGVDSRKVQAAALRAWDIMPESDKGPPAVPVTIEERQTVVERYREENRRLCERFGFEMSSFELPDDKSELPAFNIPADISPAFLESFSSALEKVRREAHPDGVKQTLLLVRRIGSSS